MSVCSALYQLLRALLKPRLSLVSENLALRQQLVILRRNASRPRLGNRDRLFWVVLSSVARLALGSGHRQAGNSNCVAPKRISFVLALEE